MKIVDCSFEAHGVAIVAILNEAIANSSALYDCRPRTMDNMVSWFQAKQAGRFPVIGLEADDGELLGFASYGTFRAFPAYKYTAEHSVYVHHAHRGRGLGERLLKEVVAHARAQGLHVLVGGIDAANQGSIALHVKLGFTPCGIIRQAGFKFGRWLDLAFYQLVLDTPAQPVDG